MKTTRCLAVMLLLIIAAHLSAVKYANEPFLMGAGVRNFALGKTGVTDFDSPALAYWNSSLLTKQTHKSFELMHAEEFNGLLKYDTISGSFGDEHAIGFTFARIGVNNINLTRLSDPTQPISGNNKPYKYKSVNNSDYILYVGIGREFGNLPVGFTPKIIYRYLAEESAFSFGADITSHFVANEFFTFGVRLRDAIPTQIYYENGTHESANFGADLEMRVDTQMPILEKPLVLYINAEINNEGIKKNAFMNIEEVSIDPHLGAEVLLHKKVSFLIGYNRNTTTAGAGINHDIYFLNYAFQQDTGLDKSHRFSIGVKL